MQRLNNIKRILPVFMLYLLIGVFGGAIGALFSHLFGFVTDLRVQNGWLIFLLPLGGALTVAIYKWLKTEALSTNNVLLSLKGETKVSPLLLPAVFLASLLTHLFGGSAGKEGAALQMGGGVASFLSLKLKLNEEESRIATLCGMSAFFSAMFGCPIGAGIFAIEVMFSGVKSLKLILPSLISGFTAFFISLGLGVHPERFDFILPNFEPSLLWKTGLIILICSGFCIFFVFSLEQTKKLFSSVLKNSYLKIILGSSAIILLTLIEGSGDYNGSGLHIIEKIFSHSEIKYEAFLLKIIFTCITVAAGFKGGEIVPTLFIGATSGAALALFLGIPAPFGGAIGMAVLFSGATNCPLAAAFLCCEMLGFEGIIYFLPASLLARLLTTKKRLYTA